MRLNVTDAVNSFIKIMGLKRRLVPGP